MKAERLFTIIGLVDEDLIEEAGRSVKRPWTQTLGTVVAACLALSLAAGPMAALLSPKGMKEEAASAPAASAPAASAPAGPVFEEQTWKFACSATENTCWADMGRDFGKMISEATDGAITVQVYAADQLTSGNQTEGIQGVIDGTIDLSAHSNIIYANFDQRLNVVSMPFLFDSYDDVDAKLTGEAGAAVGKEIVDDQNMIVSI